LTLNGHAAAVLGVGSLEGVSQLELRFGKG